MQRVVKQGPQLSLASDQTALSGARRLVDVGLRHHSQVGRRPDAAGHDPDCRAHLSLQDLKEGFQIGRQPGSSSMLQRSSDVSVSCRSDLLLLEFPAATGHLPKLRGSRTNSLTQVAAVRAEGQGPVQGALLPT